MKRNITSNILIGVITLLLTFPFINTVFFLRTLDVFIALLLGLTASALIVIIFIVYCFVERRKYFRFGVLAVIFFTFAIFCVSYGLQLDTADYVFYKQREKKLNEFVHEIKQYGKITEMSDGNRYSKSLNDSLYDFKKEDTIGGGRRIFLYQDLLKVLSIDEKVHQDFRKRLMKIDCITFDTFSDGAVCFTIDGWAGNCYGITYSPSGKQHTNYGEGVVWKHIEDNWYAWGN